MSVTVYDIFMALEYCSAKFAELVLVLEYNSSINLKYSYSYSYPEYSYSWFRYSYSYTCIPVLRYLTHRVCLVHSLPVAFYFLVSSR